MKAASEAQLGPGVSTPSSTLILLLSKRERGEVSLYICFRLLTRRLELTQRVNFANPFIIACGTKNTKFTSIAIVCLQRLIVSRALPRSKLNQVLEALQQATSAGLDVQLKILQALPSLLSNYATDLKGELLVTALNICFILQSSKNAIVNNTSAATLQQLVISVFDKVVTEDGMPERSTNHLYPFQIVSFSLILNFLWQDPAPTRHLQARLHRRTDPSRSARQP